MDNHRRYWIQIGDADPAQLTAEQIAEAFHAGLINWDTEACDEGASQWTVVRRLPTLGDAIRNRASGGTVDENPAQRGASSQQEREQARMKASPTRGHFWDRVERAGLFVATRFLSIVAILFLFAGLCGVVLLYPTVRKDTSVSLKEVKIALLKDKEGPISAQEQLPDVHVPPTVARHLDSADNQKILIGWLEDLDTAERDDFLANLDQLILQAEANHDDVVAIINQYKLLKLRKISSGNFDKYAEEAKRGALILFGTLIVGLIGLFSLVLVLLAIERNTRQL